MKKIYTLLLAFALIQGAFAQDSLQVAKKSKTPIGGRPNIPSDLKFEFGFNQLNNKSEDLSMRFFASRTFNVYYQYPVSIFRILPFDGFHKVQIRWDLRNGLG